MLIKTALTSNKGMESTNNQIVVALRSYTVDEEY